MNIKRLLLAGLFSAPFAFAVTGCSSSDTSGSTIRILNLEDYIYIDEEDEQNNLVHQFERYAEDELGYKDVHVVYDTSDTNESEYNDLLTGRINYDLVCTSDYMLQKFVREGLVTTLPEDKEALHNYNTYASKMVKERLDQIEVTTKDGVVTLEQYAVGYMWGTLGLLVNPNFDLMKDNGLDEEKVIADAQSWDILWNSDYKNTASIKNSMRDTYAVALMHGYDKDLNSLKEQYNNGELEPADYNAKLSTIFNLRDEEKTLPMVKEELNTLKGNVFGLEVDSGKQDIVTGKIGLNLAWSGDAVYSMDQAENPELVSEPFELYYSIPENGSNIWFDGWAIPTNDKRSQETYDLAVAFLDYISRPDIAALNMEYSGYTSFIGGDDILDLVRDWYDIRTEEVFETAYYCTNEECDYHVFDEPDEEHNTCPECGHPLDLEGESFPIYAVKDEEYFEVGYLDMLSKYHDELCDEYQLHYFIPFDDVEAPRDVDELFENGDFVPLRDEEGLATDKIKTYGDLTIVDDPEEGLEEVDLTYFFNGTLSEDYIDDDMKFYSDCYLPFENEDGSANVSVGRQFFCQYPSEETILRCAVMEDYGEDNIKIVKLWEDFKSNPLPTWAIILLIAEVATAGLVVTYLFTSKYIKKKLRMSRKGEDNKSK